MCIEYSTIIITTLLLYNCIINHLVYITTAADTNECGSANGGCEHNCNNTVGSFTCSCRPGFVLAGNNLNCTGSLNYCLSYHA